MSSTEEDDGDGLASHCRTAHAHRPGHGWIRSFTRTIIHPWTSICPLFASTNLSEENYKAKQSY